MLPKVLALWPKIAAQKRQVGDAIEIGFFGLAHCQPFDWPKLGGYIIPVAWPVGRRFAPRAEQRLDLRQAPIAQGSLLLNDDLPLIANLRYRQVRDKWRRLRFGMISDAIPDWTRERQVGWMPSRSLLSSIRSYQKNRARGGFAIVARIVAVLRYRFWSAVTGADIPLNTRLGGGLMLPHPNGIVIHSDAKIGPNCLIFQQVTIGSNGRGVPSIGGHVDIGAGAKILGPIHVGSHAVIGANAVVISDVPEGATMVGIPATQVPTAKAADRDSVTVA